MPSIPEDVGKEQSPRQDLPDEGTALPSASTNHEGGSAPADLQTESMPTTRRSKASAKPETTYENDPDVLLKSVRRKASLLIHDPAVRPEDRIIILRHYEDAKQLGLRDVDLTRLLVQAQAEKDGRPTVIADDIKLDRKPIRWLVEDILIKDGTNLVYAEPKAGKTRFLLALLGAVLNGEGKYLDKQIFDKSEKLMICGPDMTQQTWAEFLEDFQLADASGRTHKRISAITCAGMNFRLDDAGIDLVEEQARQNPGLIILIDAFASCMWGLGHDENKSTAVDPLMRLMNAVAPFKATLIVVHHAKKQNGEVGVSGAARGSSAITAVVDQIVSMKPVRKPGTEEETGEVLIQTRGRASKPISLSVRQGTDGKSWESLGSPEERAATQRVERDSDALTDMQRRVLAVVCHAYADNKTPCTLKDISLAIGKNPVTARRQVQGYVDGLVETRGFMKRAGQIRQGKAKASVLYLPTSEGLTAFDRALGGDVQF